LQLFTEGNDIGPQQIDRVCETRREPQDLVGERGEDGEEIRREWLPVREDESIERRRRWCVVAVLKRRE